ncbi:hypothetical protein J6590_103261, partial [Homalodisca vitripennis]
QKQSNLSRAGIVIELISARLVSANDAVYFSLVKWKGGLFIVSLMGTREHFKEFEIIK